MTRRTVLAAVVAGALVAPAAAPAHTGIDSRSPGRGATVSKSLSLVKVNFKARISDADLTVRRGGTTVSSGAGTMARRKRQVRVRLSSVRSGSHTATVRWLSRDGHVTSSTWTFRVR